MSSFGILVINPGSTSDEVSFFKGRKLIFHKTVRYTPEDLKPFENQKVTAQFEMRKKVVMDALTENGIEISEINAVIGRGGLVKPIESGVYEVTDKLTEDLKTGVMGDHPSNLGGLIAKSIANDLKIKAFIADPVVVDEMDPLARYSGMPENPRISIFHALNQKRVARHAAKQLGKPYEECNLIVMHGGGGISVGAHKKGKVVDVNNALDGEGPFTPQRSGGVPSGGLVKMCFSGKYTLEEMKLKLKGRGGLVAYTGTSDIVAIKKYIKTGEISGGIKSELVTREKAKEVLLAMAYQIAKEIGALSTVLEGKVDAIVLTGGIVYDDEFIVPEIKKRVEWIAPIIVYPGGDEMTALMIACETALKNPKKIKIYN
ncbi:MAG: butyrate kinase [Elusimicrobiota bacterium]